jgi:Meiotically Up-regulated Gene 113 (MUG113) protein
VVVAADELADFASPGARQVSLEQLSPRASGETDDPESWPLSDQPVHLEEIPWDALANAFEAIGVRTWADVDALGSPSAALLLYKGVGRRALYWVHHEVERRKSAVHYRSSGTVAMRRYVRMAHADKPFDRSGVYFIQCGPFVKIGQAKSVRSRFRGHQQNIPFQLQLLGVIEPGEGQSLRDLERVYHQRFKAFRQVAEWFRLEGELDMFCLRLAKGESVE